MEAELGDESSSPSYSDRTPAGYVNAELQQDMQMLKNDDDMFQGELLALKEENVQLQKEIKEKINSMDDLDCLTQSTETASENCLSPYSNYENFMLLIKQLCKDCKDSDSLYKIKNEILSYERSIERGKNQCELLIKKVKTMENRVSELHQKLSEAREIKSQVEHQKVKLEGELCNLRFTLKEEKEKRQKSDELYEKIREQLIKKEEQYIKETEMNKELETTLRTLNMQLQIVRKKLSQVVGERNDIQRQLTQEQNARKLQDENLAKLICKHKEIERTYKEMNSEVGGERNNIQRQLFQEQNARKLQDENLAKLLCKQKEIERTCKEMKSENDDLTTKLKTSSSKCTCLLEKNKILQQELLCMKSIEKKCEKLENKKKKLKQEVVNLKRHMEVNMIELSEVVQYKQTIEERARQDVADKLKQLNFFLQTQRACTEMSEQFIEEHNASVRIQWELRNKDLESELSKVQTSLDDNKRELKKYEQLYLEELKGRKSLENKLTESKQRLSELNMELLLEKQQTSFLLSACNTRPSLETPHDARLNNSVVPNRRSSQRGDWQNPTSRPCASTYVIKMRQEFEETLTRELQEDAAEFESECCRTRPVQSIGQSHSYDHLLLKTKQEYVEFLKKKYMI